MIQLASEKLNAFYAAGDPQSISVVNTATELLISDLQVVPADGPLVSEMQRIASEFREKTSPAIRAVSGEDSRFSCILAGIAVYQHLREVQSDHPVVRQHREEVINAFKNAHAEPLFTMFNFKSNPIPNLESLLEYTNLILDYVPDNYPFLSPRDLEWSYYTTYYHQLICRAREVLIDVACLEDDEDAAVKFEKKLELEQLALSVINGLYNFLADVSDVDTCPLNIRTILRLHLIDFGQPERLDDEDFEFECDADLQFASKLDIATRDLRIASADLKFVGEKSQFINKNWQQFRTSRYCYDIA